MAVVASRTLKVAFGSEIEPMKWAGAHKAGNKPGVWPYGLEHLASRGRFAHLEMVSAQPLRGLGTLRALRGGRERLPEPIEGGDIRLAWDELIAVRLLQESVDLPLYSGVIWATDTQKGPKNAILKLLAHRNLIALNGLWCLSRPQVDRIQEWLGREAPPVSFLRFGIDDDFFSYEAYPENPLIFSVNGDRNRDAATLFDALEKVHKAHPSAEIVVQTRSPLRPPCGVRVLPFLSHIELRRLYARASVVAIATEPNAHASGMTVSLEAMATGRPVVMTDTPGIRDYIADGLTGVLVPVRDSGGMADAIGDLIRSPLLAEHMGKRGREKVEREHTAASMAAAIDKIIGVSGQAGES